MRLPCEKLLPGNLALSLFAKAKFLVVSYFNILLIKTLVKNKTSDKCILIYK